MKWLLIAAAAIVLLNAERSPARDVGKLLPVQVICVSQVGDEIRVETDSGEFGSAGTPDAALEDLRETAGKEIFFDTADFLLVTAETEKYIGSLEEYLRPACAVCITAGEIEMEQVADFLEIHRPERTLAEYRAGIRDLPLLYMEDGRLRIVS